MSTIVETNRQSSSTERRPLALKALPPFPRVAMNVLEELSAKDDVDARRVTAFIESDVAFAAELLRIANSPLYAFACRVESVQFATVALGYDLVKSLCLTVALRAFLKGALNTPLLRKCWRHSLATALLAERVANACHLDGEDNYTAGLLHDVGLLALLAANPKEYAAVLARAEKTGHDLAACERNRFDIDHYEAGALLAAEWKLPVKLVEVIRTHHLPQEGPVSLGHVVHAGCLLADFVGFRFVEWQKATKKEEVLAAVPPEGRNRLEREFPDLRVLVETRIRSIE